MKYKINRNRTPLTDEDFSSGRNFNKVLKGYRSMKIPFYRSGKFLTTGSAIIVAVAVGLIVLFGEDQEKPEAKFISPPLSQVVIPSDTYRVDADSATEIDYKTGSKLHIPAGAFKDAAGNAIKGNVDIQYREFHDQKDIFLSGIPMTYDSAGKTYVFESAGMMEISATQDGKPVLTNPEKPIKVDMVSNTAEDRYNTYYLDTTAKKWVNLNEANLMKPQNKQVSNDSGSSTSLLGNKDISEENAADPALAKCEQKVKVAVAEVKAVEKEKPMPIAQADRTKSKFHIVVDAGEFPEIAMYKGVHFQVKDEKTFNPASAKTEWEDVKLKKLSGIDYEVTFTKGTEVFKVVATPVFDGNDLAVAKKVYDKKYSEYQAKLTEKKEAEAKAKREYEKQLAQQKRDEAKVRAEMEKWNRENAKQLADAQKPNAELRKTASFQKVEIAELKNMEMRGFSDARDARIKQTELVYRTFVVAKFGVYNADCPYTWPSSGGVVASFKSEKGEKLDLGCVYLVTRGINIVYPFYGGDGVCNDFKFDSSKNNALWAVTKDNRLVVVDMNTFKSCQIKDRKIEFKFKMADKELSNAEEVKKYLEI